MGEDVRVPDVDLPAIREPRAQPLEQPRILFDRHDPSGPSGERVRDRAPTRAQVVDRIGLADVGPSDDRFDKFRIAEEVLRSPESRSVASCHVSASFAVVGAKRPHGDAMRPKRNPRRRRLHVVRSL